MTPSFRRGRRLGKYRLERKLGEGGSAVVWQARDTIEGRRVAVKIILPAVVKEFGREAVENEARFAAQLDHPKIARIRNADWINEHFVIVSDLAKSSLDRSVSAKRSPSRIASIVTDIAEGLAHAHQQGLIHRDVKPANILLYPDGAARLADFGTAKMHQFRTHMRTEAGTMGYMAPEQAYGRPRYASDVFSLAVTAYELFSGVLPGWPFEWPLEGNRRFESRCPMRLQPVIRRALSLDFERRYENGIYFHRALCRALEETDLSRPSQERLHSRRRTPPAEPFALEAGWFRKKWGRTFETRFNCHACDGPIAESMSNCPWCGSKDNSFIEITSFRLVCPECERGVRPEWGACPTCSRGRFEANGRAIPGASSAERTCKHPGCGAPIHRFMKFCPGCKDRVARPWKVEGVSGCRKCRWPLVSRWRFCAWCGQKNPRTLVVDQS